MFLWNRVFSCSACLDIWYTINETPKAYFTNTRTQAQFICKNARLGKGSHMLRDRDNDGETIK